MHWRASFIVATAVLLSCCSDDGGNPFLTQTRPPSAQSVVMFVSSSWNTEPGAGRELMAADASGVNVERLTSCAQAEDPCDVLQFAVSTNPSRVALVRTTVDAAPGTSALYFVDLSRSAEKLIFPRKLVTAVDWLPDDSLLIYASPTESQGGSAEDLFICAPDGTGDENLTATTGVRERSPRADPFGRTAVFEGIDATGVGRIYLYSSTPVPLTSGPAAGPALPDTSYVVGGDADPAFSPTADRVVFRRLTSTGNGGLGTWDLIVTKSDGTEPTVIVSGALARSAPDWGAGGILFVETDAASRKSQLVVVQPDGSGRRVILEQDAAYGLAAPRWIPGRTIATAQ